MEQECNVRQQQQRTENTELGTQLFYADSCRLY